MTPKNSSFASASRVKFASGSETSGLKHIENSALISPRVDRLHDLDRASDPGRAALLVDAPDAGDVARELRDR